MAYRDKRTPITTKLLAGLSIFYFFSPIDLVPDFVPFLGLADDLFMVPFLISTAIKTIPIAVLTDARLKLRKTRNWFWAIVILCICAVAVYYGYQYFRKDIPTVGDY